MSDLINVMKSVKTDVREAKENETRMRDNNGRIIKYKKTLRHHRDR